MAAQFDRSSVNLEQCAAVEQHPDNPGEAPRDRGFQVDS
jgi:hypothetical protein